MGFACALSNCGHWGIKAFSVSTQHTFEEAEKGFDETLAKEKGMNRDDRIHGALLILNELVRISSMEGEVRHRDGGAWASPVPLSEQDGARSLSSRS